MREIKFRAWNKLAHKMADITMLDFMLDAYRAIAGKSSGSGHLADIDLMQYTGLKDKNGKEIYEGDIIKTEWYWETPHAIVWPDDYYAFVEYSLDEANIEVIGNIYENGELLPKDTP